MAARDRNLVAWQAYVIVMSMVAVGLMVGLAISVSSHSNTNRSKDDALSRATQFENETRKLTAQIEFLKAMLGISQPTPDEWNKLKESSVGDAKLVTLLTQYEKDMHLFGANEPIQNQNYPKLTETLIGELRDRNLQIDTANRSQAELVKKTESAIKNESEARVKAEARADKMEKDLEVARADFQSKLDAGQQAITQVSETLQKKIAEFAKEKATLEAKSREDKERADKFLALNLKLNRRVREVEGEEFQSAQGKIVNTAEGGNVVWINLGSADELRPGVKFGIIDPNVTRLKEASPKAHLEIAEILGPNLSRGKVISGNIQVPVVMNDLVYSVVWQKGRKMQFALLGKMDINRDGLDDRDTLKAMIVQGGGVVTEDLSPDGKSAGRMTVDTNWLVVGESFKVSANDELDTRQKDFRSKYADMQLRAKELAVSQINLDKLLNWLQSGSQTERTVPLTGSGSTGNEAPRRVPYSKGAVSELYMEKERAAAFGAPK
jgi:hypothetical protein